MLIWPLAALLHTYHVRRSTDKKREHTYRQHRSVTIRGAGAEHQTCSDPAKARAEGGGGGETDSESESVAPPQARSRDRRPTRGVPKAEK